MLNSLRRGNEGYLEHAAPLTTEHLKKINEVLFIPYAEVTLDWDKYTQIVQAALPNLKVKGIHQFDDAKQAVNSTKVIFIGGGNTFNLLQ